jgi:hypothetical protein
MMSEKPNRAARRHPQSMLGNEVMFSNQVSDETRIPGGTLRYWRATGQGPKWFRIGDRRVAYLRSDVEAWLAQQYESA